MSLGGRLNRQQLLAAAKRKAAQELFTQELKLEFPGLRTLELFDLARTMRPALFEHSNDELEFPLLT